jgi:hypothetical protein
MTALPRPGAGEFAEYYGGYVAQVPDGDILEILRDQLGDTLALLQGVPEGRETYRYAEGKWSIREVVGHLVDTEWLFTYRALTMAREEGADLPGMDQDLWVRTSRADERPLAESCEEWAALRRAGIHLFASMNEEQGARSGVASGNPFTVRSFPWIIAGHELWHRRLIEERYLDPEG